MADVSLRASNKRVVLVRTIGPRNAGSALRAVANFGPADLWFVAPARPSLLEHPEFEQMAHGVERIRERVRVVERLEDALADCSHSLGFTARPRDRKRVDWPEFVPEARRWCSTSGARVALVFGSEENGLTETESDLCQLLVHIPTSGEHQSINLALALGIVLHDLFAGPGRHVRERGPRMADQDSVSYLKHHLKAVLAGRVARSSAAQQDIEGSIERVFSRAPIESRDARAWNMMMRALGSQLTPKDFGIEKQSKNSRRDRVVQAARAKPPQALPPGASG